MGRQREGSNESNEKSRMGLLRMADIDEYIVAKCQIHESARMDMMCVEADNVSCCALHPLDFAFVIHL